MTIAQIRTHLEELAQEHHEASRIGLSTDSAYIADLKEEIAIFRMALVTAAVTEIAVERGELFGRQVG